MALTSRSLGGEEVELCKILDQYLTTVRILEKSIHEKKEIYLIVKL